MSGKHLWKLIATIVIVAISLSYLVPWEDQDFGEYLRTASESEEFHQILDRSQALTRTDDQVVSVYMALKKISNDERTDLSQYFPQISLEPSLRNIEKRNGILLNALLKDSKANLRKGPCRWCGDDASSRPGRFGGHRKD